MRYKRFFIIAIIIGIFRLRGGGPSAERCPQRPRDRVGRGHQLPGRARGAWDVLPERAMVHPVGRRVQGGRHHPLLPQGRREGIVAHSGAHQRDTAHTGEFGF